MENFGKVLEKLKEEKCYIHIKSEKEYKEILEKTKSLNHNVLEFGYTDLWSAYIYDKSRNVFRLEDISKLLSDYKEIKLDYSNNIVKLKQLLKEAKISEDETILILPKGNWKLIDNKLICMKN